METILRLVKDLELLGFDPTGLERFRRSGAQRIDGVDAVIYRRSIRASDGVLFFVGAVRGEKSLYLVSERTFAAGFAGTSARVGGISILKATFSPGNARLLHERFPFTAPVSLRERKTTIGCGDRLGLATPGHIRAITGYEVSPVLAQQSIRELTLTGRDYPGVVSDATFLVFQEGYGLGYGADGDHLKTMKDIDAALAAGMPMITLDLSGVISAQPASWADAKVDDEFEKIDPQTRSHVLERYADKTFRLAGAPLRFTATEARRCALMYLKALEFAHAVDGHLREKRGSRYDLEISIDETTTPTLPAHHLFFANELTLRGVTVSSLAPRFIGEFQKGIDYIGDSAEFERQIAVHCDIARAFGGYKVSIHSGSDKFSVYPAIGRHTGMRLHLKTAGTSWLQAVRVIARANAGLFRSMVDAAIGSFAEASKLYQVSLDPKAIPDPSGLADSELEGLLESVDSRQLLHITYGSLLENPDLRAGIFRTLIENEEAHYAAVQENLERHLKLLGAAARE
jgi:tagaturonate epimerase